jgi:hypothetical protein
MDDPKGASRRLINTEMKYLIPIIVFLLWATPALATNTNDAVFTSTANKNLQAIDSTSISVTGTLTVQFAVKITGVPTDTQGLLGNYSATGNTDRAYYCQRDVANTITCGVFSGATGFNVTSVTALTTGTWYCVVFKYQPSTAVRIYLDASCDAAPALDNSNTTSIPASINNSTASFTLGSYTAFVATAANVLAGSMDDVRIWAEDHTFTTDYNCQITGSETNLKVYWTLNNVLTDSTANANTLTNNNSVVINDTTVPFSSDCAVAAGASYTPSPWWLLFW